MVNKPVTKSEQLLDFSKQAIKFISKQDQEMQKRLREAIEEYPDGIEKLKGYKLFKKRVGDIRIIFNDKGKIVKVELVGNRGEIYRRVQRGNY